MIDADSTDQELLAAHVEGDPEAFGILFGRHRDRLWAVAMRTTGDTEDAADALQDAMVSAFRRAASFRGDSQVTTWLHRVVVNACLDRLRSNKVRRSEALPDDVEDWSERGSLVTVDASPRPDDAALDSERQRDVVRALASLPVEQRAALVLVDMEGHSVAEAAAILDCAVGTVKSRCARGRARLAPLLGIHAPGGPDHPEAGNRSALAAVETVRPVRGPPAEPRI